MTMYIIQILPKQVSGELPNSWIQIAKSLKIDSTTFQIHHGGYQVVQALTVCSISNLLYIA